MKEIQKSIDARKDFLWNGSMEGCQRRLLTTNI